MCFSGFWLKLFALGFMLIDHIGYVLYPNIIWFRAVGRLSFPIFVFLLVEGYKHTRHQGKYVARLLVLAVLSEPVFDIAFYGKPVYFGAQNIFWTLLFGLLLLRIYDILSKENGLHSKVFAGFVCGFVSICLGIFLRNDYDALGFLTILVFYWFCGSGWKRKACLFVSMFLLYGPVCGGFPLLIDAGSFQVVIPVSILACGSLPFIWHYNGRRGYNAAWFRWGSYFFYPVHLLALYLVSV